MNDTTSLPSGLERFMMKLSNPKSEYLRLSRTAVYSFMIALPLFILYEILIFTVNFDGGRQLGLSVEFLFKKIMLSAGTMPMLGLSIVVLLIGIFIFFRSRKKDVPIKKKYFGWMLGESLVYAFLMGLIISSVVGTIFGSWIMETGQIGNSLSFWEMITLSIGAGLYEEFFFRLILVGGLFWIVKQFYGESNYWKAYLIVAIVGALIFSGVHYVGNMGDDFTMASFTFRFLLGLVLNGIFLVRGFGIAAWTHSLYDILVTMMA